MKFWILISLEGNVFLQAQTYNLFVDVHSSCFLNAVTAFSLFWPFMLRIVVST